LPSATELKPLNHESPKALVGFLCFCCFYFSFFDSDLGDQRLLGIFVVQKLREEENSNAMQMNFLRISWVMP
jgi:hypothetical protein